MINEMKKWDRSLGTSKREQGVVTMKRKDKERLITLERQQAQQMKAQQSKISDAIKAMHRRKESV